MGSEISFQNKLNATDIIQKCRWLYFNQKQESVLRSDCENVRSTLMEFIEINLKIT